MTFEKHISPKIFIFWLICLKSFYNGFGFISPVYFLMKIYQLFIFRRFKFTGGTNEVVNSRDYIFLIFISGFECSES